MKGAAKIRITEHALFRWLERTGVVDVPALRVGLAAALDRAYQAGAALDQSEFLILSGGLVYLVRDGALITVLENDGRHSQARQFTPPIESGPSISEVGQSETGQSATGESETGE